MKIQRKRILVFFLILSIFITSGFTISLIAFFITSTSVLFVFMASLPPFKTHALAVLRHKDAISTQTFGLDSNITAITPKGTLIFFIQKR